MFATCFRPASTESAPSKDMYRFNMAAEKVQRASSVSVNVLVTEIRKHLCEETVEHDLLSLLAHEFRAQRMGLAEFCVRLRMLIGAAVLMAAVHGLSRQAACASPRACRNDTFKERPAKRSLVKEEVASPAVAMGNGSATSPRTRRACRAAATLWATTPAEEARLRALLALESGKQQWTGAGDAI